MTKAQKLIAAILVAIVIVLIGGVMLTKTSEAPNTAAQPLGGNGFAAEQAFYLTPASGVQIQAGETSATTSIVFLQTGDTASTTLTAGINKSQNADLYLQGTASSTASKLQYVLFFSMNGIDWYPEDCKSINSTSNVTHTPVECIHEWTPGTTAVTRKNYTLGAIQAKYLQIRFHTVSANLGLWASLVINTPDPN